MAIATKPLTFFLAGLLSLGVLSLHGPAFASGGAKPAAKKDHAGAEKGEGGGEDGKETPSDPTEVSMPPVIVPVTRDGKLIGYLYVGVILKAEDAAIAAQIKKAMPLVQDATLRAMNNNPVPVEHAEDEGTKDLILEHLEAALAHLDGVPQIDSIKIHDILKVPF